MLIGSPFEHFEALKTEYVRQFPADTPIWGFGPNALAQDTERTRVIYTVAEKVEIADDEGWAGQSNFTREIPLQGQSVRLVTIEIFCCGRAAVLFNTRNEQGLLVPGLANRVNSALQHSLAGPFRLDEVEDAITLADYSDLKFSMWQWKFQVRIPVPFFDLSRVENVAGVVLAPISSFNIGEGGVTQ